MQSIYELTPGNPGYNASKKLLTRTISLELDNLAYNALLNYIEKAEAILS